MGSQVTFDRSQGRNSSGKARNRKRAAYKLPIACSGNLLIEPRITCLGLALPTLPTSTINQENVPQDMPTNKSDRGNSSVEVPSFQVTLVCSSLTKATCMIAHVSSWVVPPACLFLGCVELWNPNPSTPFVPTSFSASGRGFYWYHILESLSGSPVHISHKLIIFILQAIMGLVLLFSNKVLLKHRHACSLLLCRRCVVDRITGEKGFERNSVAHKLRLLSVQPSG